MGERPETFGGVVRERMRRRGVSPKELAAVIHRSESQVSLLLRDRISAPPPDVVAAIATHLGLDERKLVRLIGYLSTVPEDEGDPGPFAASDPRSKVVELLSEIRDDDLAAVTLVAERLARRGGA